MFFVYYKLFLIILQRINTIIFHVNEFKRKCEFIAGAATYEQAPKTTLPEFAFIGRSNVGKSSIINTLVDRKTLVRTSKTPGCTKQINFFELDGILILADLPGYGYAKISKSERDNWDLLIHNYLRKRSKLKRIFLLIDSRHELKESDKKTMDYLDEYGLSYQIVLTKVDKSSQHSKLENTIKASLAKHPACHPHIITTSSITKHGVEELQNEILQLAQQ